MCGGDAALCEITLTSCCMKVISQLTSSKYSLVLNSAVLLYRYRFVVQLVAYIQLYRMLVFSTLSWQMILANDV